MDTDNTGFDYNAFQAKLKQNLDDLRAEAKKEIETRIRRTRWLMWFRVGVAVFLALLAVVDIHNNNWFGFWICAGFVAFNLLLAYFADRKNIAKMQEMLDTWP